MYQHHKENEKIKANRIKVYYAIMKRKRPEREKVEVETYRGKFKVLV